MHRCDYFDRIENIDGELVRITTAVFKTKKLSKSLDVCKQTENNINYARNVEYNMYCGYGIIFPDDIYYGQEYGLDEYGLTDRQGKKVLPLYERNRSDFKDLITVYAKYPDFKKIVDDYKLENNFQIINSLYYWKKNKKDFEFLLKNELYELAYSEKFYLLEEKEKEIIFTAIDSYPVCDIPLNKFLNTVKLKKEFKYFNFETIYRLNYGCGYEKNEMMSFLSVTKEFNKLTQNRQKEFYEYFNDRKNDYILRKFSYPQFKKLCRNINKYPKTSVKDLWEISKDYADYRQYARFYCTYNSKFTYTIRKLDRKYKTKQNVIQLFENWKNYPSEVEALTSLNMINVATNSGYYQTDRNFKKETVRFIRNHKNFIKENNYIYPSELEHLLKIKDYTDDEVVYVYNNFRFDTTRYDRKTIQYLMKNKIEGDEYTDYLELCEELLHDTDDEYWKLPKDFAKQNKKIKKEMENFKKNEEKITAEKYFNIVKKYIKDNPKAQIDGYEIFIPETIEDIKLQAEILNQCLIRCNYPEKVINNKCVLVFLRENGKPVATCEIARNQIVQFRQLNNQTPSEQMIVAMNKWFDSSELKKDKKAA